MRNPIGMTGIDEKMRNMYMHHFSDESVLEKLKIDLKLALMTAQLRMCRKELASHAKGIDSKKSANEKKCT